MAAVELHSEITFFVLSRGIAIITNFCCFLSTERMCVTGRRRLGAQLGGLTMS